MVMVSLNAIAVVRKGSSVMLHHLGTWLGRVWRGTPASLPVAPKLDEPPEDWSAERARLLEGDDPNKIEKIARLLGQ